MKGTAVGTLSSYQAATEALEAAQYTDLISAEAMKQVQAMDLEPMLNAAEQAQRSVDAVDVIARTNPEQILNTAKQAQQSIDAVDAIATIGPKQVLNAIEMAETTNLNPVFRTLGVFEGLDQMPPPVTFPEPLEPTPAAEPSHQEWDNPQPPVKGISLTGWLQDLPEDLSEGEKARISIGVTIYILAMAQNSGATTQQVVAGLTMAPVIHFYIWKGLLGQE